MTSDTNRAIARHCPFWHAEAVAMVARHTDAVNRAYAANPSLALDSANPHPNSIDPDIAKFFAKDQAMPYSNTNPSSGAPPARYGQTDTGYSVGGQQYARRNAGVRDQANGVSAAQILDLIDSGAMPDEEIEMLLNGLSQRYGGNGMPAEDQGNPRLPDNGNGVSPADFFNQSSEGTWAQGDPQSRGPSGTADSRYGYDRRPRDPRQRRTAHDRRLASGQDTGSFFDRFPSARAIEVWGR